MSDLEDFTGLWTGYWQQRGLHGKMEIALHLASRRIEGEGVDDIGKFRILGAYSLAGYTVQFIKSYPTHEILYEGIWDGKRLSGTWVLQGRKKSLISSWLGYSGSFELWPTPDSYSSSEGVPTTPS